MGFVNPEQRQHVGYGWIPQLLRHNLLPASGSMRARVGTNGAALPQRDRFHQGLCATSPIQRVRRLREPCHLYKPQHLVYCRLRGSAALCGRM